MTRALSALALAFYIIKIHAFEAVKTFVWFTVLPVGRVTDLIRAGEGEEFSYEISIYQYYYLPLVGLVKFALATLLCLALSQIWHPALAAGLAAMAYLVVTGGIHLDGLTDTFDALFAYGKDRWVVLKDPHIGALGAVYLNFFVLLFVGIVGTNLYWTLQHGQFWQLAVLAHAAILPKLNCYILLNDQVATGQIKLDSHFQLTPKYPGWADRPLTSTKAFYGIALALLMLDLTLLDFRREAIFYLLSAFAVILWFNLRVLPGVTRNLGFLAGDVFGWQICLLELAHQFLYALWFVRN